MSKKTDRVIFTFPILWEGWECDSEAWIMERPDGTRYLRMTSHGSEFEANVDHLYERLAEYVKVIAKTREALALLNEN